MRKNRTDPITSRDLVEYLDSTDSFQLELDVFNSCIVRGFNAAHGGSYADPITGKDRQFDVRAQLTKGLCTMKLAIECKNLQRHFPLLISRVPRRTEESFHELVLSGPERLRMAVNEKQSTGADSHRFKYSCFPSRDAVGKSTVQVGRTTSGELTSSDAEVYEKWAQAVASALDLVAHSVRDYEIVASESAATAIFPVLVVSDHSLWTVDYSAVGQRIAEPQPAARCTIYLGKKVLTGERGVDYTISHLYIFTQTEFTSYLDALVSPDTMDWECIFPSPELNKQLLLLEMQQGVPIRGQS